MQKKHKQLLVVAVALLAIGGGIGGMIKYQNKPDRLDGFAQCLKDKKITFYGAFWCPHCQSQKAMFGRSDRLLPYVECSEPSGLSQNATCNQKEVKSYPTWEFADGSRETGEVALDKLAEKSGCALP